MGVQTGIFSIETGHAANVGNARPARAQAGQAPVFVALGQFAAPCIGQHTEYVLTNLLDMSDDEFVELTQRGVFS